MRRLFIAVNLPDEAKNKIRLIIEKLKEQGGERMRFLPPENWHITLTFLGYQPDEALPAISKSLREVADNFFAHQEGRRKEGFNIRFSEVAYAPPGKLPRMIWLVADKATSQIISGTKNNLEDKLEQGGVRFRREDRQYNAHITLTRFENQSAENLPELSVGKSILPIIFWCFSLDLMESHLKRTGAEYDILSAFSL